MIRIGRFAIASLIAVLFTACATTTGGPEYPVASGPGSAGIRVPSPGSSQQTGSLGDETADSLLALSAMDHRIGADDLLEIIVLEAPEFSRTVRVSERGEIPLPLVGIIPAGGHTARELEVTIAERLRTSYMLDPQVTVEVKEIRSHPIYVMGEVNRPGAFPLGGTQRITVLHAVSLGQGLRPMAAKGRTVIIRTTPAGERVKIPVDLGDVLAGRASDIALQSNDIVFVPTNAAKSVASGVLTTLLRIVTFRAVF
jgi:polysaccharide biosynthesis/export protein